jgi:hypothetical protein
LVTTCPFCKHQNLYEPTTVELRDLEIVRREIPIRVSQHNLFGNRTNKEVISRVTEDKDIGKIRRQL